MATDLGTCENTAVQSTPHTAARTQLEARLTGLFPRINSLCPLLYASLLPVRRLGCSRRPPAWVEA